MCIGSCSHDPSLDTLVVEVASAAWTVTGLGKGDHMCIGSCSRCLTHGLFSVLGGCCLRRVRLSVRS